MVLQKLIDMLMQAGIENAGAERGLLVLPSGSELHVKAEAMTAGDTIVVRLRDPAHPAPCEREHHDGLLHQDGCVDDVRGVMAKLENDLQDTIGTPNPVLAVEPPTVQ